ncbi:MAG: helix-turn-helix domain-containing protein [Microcoleaceae cyanobacterium]
MNSPSIPDYGPQLQQFMRQVGLLSLSELSQKAQVSGLQLSRLQKGLAAQMPLPVLVRISQSLQMPITQFLATFAPELNLGQPAVYVSTAPASVARDSMPDLANLQTEYERLQQQLENQRETLEQEFQRNTIQALEAFLLQWPTVAQRTQENPQLPATRLLPLARPIEQLLQEWGVESIAQVGQVVNYDPQVHQLLQGNVQPGSPVVIRYAGYFYQGQLLYRAKVSPAD